MQYLLIIYSILLTTFTLAQISIDTSIDTNHEDPIEVYYINLQSSKERNIAMQNHLKRRGFTFKRVEAIEIGSNKDYNLSDVRYPCDHSWNPIMEFKTNILKYSSIQINRLCISPVNTHKEIAVVLSHLKAILTAVHSSNNNEYALILEDDMTIAFDIDFKDLIQHAPNDFAILQLFTINHIDTTKLIELYVKDNNILFTPWIASHWSAAAYIINKRYLWTALNQLINLNKQLNNGIFNIDLIAADSITLVPKYCYDNERNKKMEYPCIESNFRVPKHGILGGIAADYYIFCLVANKTYTSSLPLTFGNQFSNNSTISDTHSLFDKISLDTAKNVIQDIYWGNIKLPSYLKLNALTIYCLHSIINHQRDKVTRLHLDELRYPYEMIEMFSFHNLSIMNEIFNMTIYVQPCSLIQPSISIPISILHSKSIKLNSLCMDASNNQKDLSLVLSHFNTILTIITSPNINPYAIIIEDDIHLLSTSIDIEAIIKEYPEDFSAVQIILTQKHFQHSKYEQHQKYKYVPWDSSFSSRHAYIINKRVVLKYIQEIGLLNNINEYDEFIFDLFTIPIGSKCPIESKQSNDYPCVESNKGIYTADYIFNFLLSAGKVFIATTPLAGFSYSLCNKGTAYCHGVKKMNSKIAEKLNTYFNY